MGRQRLAPVLKKCRGRTKPQTHGRKKPTPLERLSHIVGGLRLCQRPRKRRLRLVAEPLRFHPLMQSSQMEILPVEQVGQPRLKQTAMELRLEDLAAVASGRLVLEKQHTQLPVEPTTFTKTFMVCLGVTTQFQSLYLDILRAA